MTTPQSFADFSALKTRAPRQGPPAAPSPRRRTHTTLFALIALLSLVDIGCGSSAKKKPLAGATPVVRDVEPALRGLIGTMTTLRGREPLLVTGYGLVVDLKGGGSSDMPAPVRSYMEREMIKYGVGQTSRGSGQFSPTELLNDPNTAVVMVRAVIPPGAPAGTKFDVMVQALPGTSTTSLEGGRLWTTSLYKGRFVPGGPLTDPLAEASGAIFINPFSDPAGDETDSVTRTTGRILSGGNVTKGLDLLLTLDNPSHARASSIVSAINSKFPQNPGDRQATAIGLSEELIELHVPARYKLETARFVELLMHTRLDQMFPREYALRYARTLTEQPSLAPSVLWAMQALGKIALPELREVYDYAEITPRLAALESGANLGDPLVEPHLLELAMDGPPVLRTRAIEMLGKLQPNPATNLALRAMLESEEMDVRIAAYEALRSRFDPAIELKSVGDKFTLETAPFGDTMIYVTQQGKPRIIVFGSRAEISRPTFVSAWNDRLMLASDSSTDDLRIYYLDHTTGRSSTSIVKPSIPKLIEFFAHETTPEAPAPGLNLTYSEVVGALHELWKGDAFSGFFVTQQDRLLADLLRSIQTVATEERPETAADIDTVENAAAMQFPELIVTPAPETKPRSYVVPLKKPAKP